MNCEPCLLKPGNAKHIKVTFKPTQLTKYEDKIEFKVNGLSKTSISAKGQGVPMKVGIIYLYIYIYIPVQEVIILSMFHIITHSTVSRAVSASGCLYSIHVHH